MTLVPVAVVADVLWIGGSPDKVFDGLTPVYDDSRSSDRDARFAKVALYDALLQHVPTITLTNHRWDNLLMMYS